MSVFDPIAFKQTTHNQWNAVAEYWNNWGPRLDRWLGPVTEQLFDMAKVGPGSRVLHIAGGSGQEALQSAKRVGADGFVLSTDLSENLTELAHQNFSNQGFLHAKSLVMDGEQFEINSAPFDAALSRVGLIYFPNQLASVKSQIAAVKSGGHVGAIVYATADECGFFSTPVGVIRRHANLGPPLPGQPGPFSLGGHGKIEKLFSDAGLVDIDVQKIEAPVVMGNAAECLRFEQESFGALHQMLSALDDDAKTAAWIEVGEKLSAYEKNGRFEGPCVMLAAVGRKP